MSKPANYPIRWERGFGWGSWRAALRLVFPGRPKPMIGYELLRVYGRGWRWFGWLFWPYYKAIRLSWTMRGPV